MTAPCPDCGSTSEFHRRHPITDREIDYDRTCDTCRHFAERTVQKVTVYLCGKAPGWKREPNTSPAAFPGCVLHEPKPRRRR